MKGKKFFVVLTAVALLSLAALFAFAGGGLARAAEKGSFTSVQQLNHPDYTIGVSTSGAAQAAVERDLPDAKTAYFEGVDSYMAVQQGRIDAYAYDRRQMEMAIANGLKGVVLLPENIGESVRIAVGISPASKIEGLKDKINRFISELKDAGTLEDMYRRWVVDGDRKMPEIELPASPNLTLKVGTAGFVPPYSYYDGSGLTGYDIELGRRFAAWLGAGIEFKIFDYGGLIAAATVGDIDCIMSNLNITPERAEKIPFSDVLYTENVAIMVRDTTAAVEEADSPVPGRYKSLDELNGKRIGVQTGGTFDAIVSARLPDVQFSYFNSYPDMAAALEAGRIDGFPGDEPVLRMMAAENDRLAVLNEYMDTFEFGFVLPKNKAGEKLREELDAYIASIQESGELKEIMDKWTGTGEGEKTLPDYRAFPAPRGTLSLATEGGYPPMNYFHEGEVVGLEIDLTARFCAAYGYGLKVVPMNFDAILTALQSGKYDFAAAGFTITEERKESAYFSRPYYSGGTVMAVLKEADAAAAPHEGTFLNSIQASFERTFIREKRWLLFAEGIGVTLLITALSILFGTALGFGLYLFCCGGNPLANIVTRFCVWLVQGMPAVVLLMILYYIVFSNTEISGVSVAVVAFTLTFGSAVYGMLRMGVGAVDSGQTEAAYALGYGRWGAFFEIVLPQALPHFMPSFRGEVASLVKATAIVGYIAVQDVTKMGDIVRSRTYEAFFPLIAVAVIYFIMAGSLNFLIDRIQICLNPKRRKRGDILRGLNVSENDGKGAESHD